MRASLKWLAVGAPLMLAAQLGALGAAGAAPGSGSAARAWGGGLGFSPAVPAWRAAGLSSLDCLASAVYYEARSESEDGQRAVAQVVLNRVRHPNYPKSVCGVVFQGSSRASGCQFTFTCDGSLARRPTLDGWVRARRIAADLLEGRGFAPVGNATHYHTKAVNPYWAGSLARLGSLGGHIFYASSGRLTGSLAAVRDEPAYSPRPQRAVAEAGAEPARTRRAPRKALVVVHRGSSSAEPSGPSPASAASAPAQTEAFGIKIHRGSGVTG